MPARLALALVAALLVLPSTASAAIQVTKLDPPSSQLTLTGGDGDEIIVLEGFSSVSASNRTFTFFSLAKFEVPAAIDCTLSDSDTRVTCTGVNANPPQAFLGDGTDSFTVSGTITADIPVVVFGQGGSDDIYGGPGGDYLFGGGGADFIEGRDGDDVMDGYVGAGNPTAGAGVDGADFFRGGRGADEMYDTGGTASDRIQYFAETGRTGGVNVTFDDAFNDGRAAFDGSSANPGDNVGPGIDWINGTDDDDTLTGGPANDTFYGNGGKDTLTGGDGHDTLEGGADDDTLNARDSDDDTADLVINCGGLSGGSPGDVANIDRADPTPTNCTTVNRSPGGGGTTPTTPATGTQPAATPGAATTPPAGTKLPLPPVGTSGAAGTVKETKTTPTADTSRMPNLVGVRVDRARDKLKALKVVADVDVREVTSSKKGLTIGEILSQSPKPGTAVKSDASRLARVRLEVVEGPKGKGGSCPGAAELAGLKGTDYDYVDQLLEARGCKKIAVVLKESAAVKEPQASSFKSSGGTTTVTVAVPSNDKRQDLFAIVRESSLETTFQGFDLDWTLPAGQQSGLGIQVVDRAGRLVGNADVTIDLSGVGKPNLSHRTTANGQVGLGGASGITVQPARAGVIRLLIQATGRDGQTLWGSGQIRVADRGTGEWPSSAGRRFQGPTCRVGQRNSATGGGCVQHWLGAQAVFDEGYGGTVQRGPEVSGAEAARYGAIVDDLRDALTFDGGVKRLLESRSLSTVNRLRTLEAGGRWTWTPGQLALDAGDPVRAGRGPRFASAALFGVRGTRVEEYSGQVVAAGQGSVVVASKLGSWALKGGAGRTAGGTIDTIDATKATVVRFRDGTGVLSTGDTPPSASLNGAVALYGLS